MSGLDTYRALYCRKVENGLFRRNGRRKVLLAPQSAVAWAKTWPIPADLAVIKGQVPFCCMNGGPKSADVHKRIEFYLGKIGGACSGGSPARHKPLLAHCVSPQMPQSLRMSTLSI